MQVQRKMARKYLRAGRVAARYDVSTSTIWRWAGEERYSCLGFPRPVAIGLQARGWDIDELDAYDARRVALRDAGASNPEPAAEAAGV